MNINLSGDFLYSDDTIVTVYYGYKRCFVFVPCNGKRRRLQE